MVQGDLPLGKVPLLRVGAAVIFESAVILEYLEETAPHPFDLLARARHRSWIAFAFSLLNDIAGFYNVAGRDAADAKAANIAAKFRHLEDELGAGPWFAGGHFSPVEAAFGPVFRYFDVFKPARRLAVHAGFPSPERPASGTSRATLGPSCGGRRLMLYSCAISWFVAAVISPKLRLPLASWLPRRFRRPDTTIFLAIMVAWRAERVSFV